MTDRDRDRRQGEQLSAAADEAKAKASGAAARARRVGEEQTDSLVDHIGRRGGAVAGALHSTGDSLRGKEDWLADAADALGDNLDRIARNAREKGPNGLRRDLEDLARERPALFLGASVTLGLALGRFLRSSPPGQHSDEAGSAHQSGPYASTPADEPAGTDAPPRGAAAAGPSGATAAGTSPANRPTGQTPATATATSRSPDLPSTKESPAPKATASATPPRSGSASAGTGKPTEKT